MPSAVNNRKYRWREELESKRNEIEIEMTILICLLYNPTAEYNEQILPRLYNPNRMDNGG